jgi:hypothetical protein
MCEAATCLHLAPTISLPPHSGGWSPNWVHSAPRPFTVLLYLPRVIVRMENFRWNEDWQGKPKYSKKTCPDATLSTTNPTWPDPGSNPGRRGGKPATNRLSYGAALAPRLIKHLVLYAVMAPCLNTRKLNNTLLWLNIKLSLLCFAAYLKY